MLVVGDRAAALAPALEVQGLAVASEATLPEVLDAFSVVVLLDVLDVAAQERLATFANDGGGGEGRGQR